MPSCMSLPYRQNNNQKLEIRKKRKKSTWVRNLVCSEQGSSWLSKTQASILYVEEHLIYGRVFATSIDVSIIDKVVLK